MKTFKVKRRWIILMTAMTLIAVTGLAVGEPTFDCVNDVAVVYRNGTDFGALGSDRLFIVLWR